jgi:3'-phosphoadenosine 5'-phosphosulfate sulfotransferase (PAPS reductase)/FAD synthetase
LSINVEDARKSRRGDRDRLSLDAKINIAKIVIRDAFSMFKRPAILFNTDKNSMVSLNIARSVWQESRSDIFPVLFVDHGRYFEETYKTLRELSDKWKFTTLTARNEDAIQNMNQHGIVQMKSLNQTNQDSAKAVGFGDEFFKNASGISIADYLFCDLPKKMLVEKYRLDSILIAEANDGSRNFDQAPFFIRSEKESPAVSICPILTFSEKDIWDYTFKFDLPINPLYYQGYSTFDDKYGNSTKSDSPPWEEHIEQTRVKKLSKEDEQEISERLKRLGYM